MYNFKLRCVRIRTVAVEKKEVFSITNVYVCILALVTRHANRTLYASYHTFSCDLSGSTTFYLSSRKWHDFRGGGDYGP